MRTVPLIWIRTWPRFRAGAGSRSAERCRRRTSSGRRASMYAPRTFEMDLPDGRALPSYQRARVERRTPIARATPSGPNFRARYASCLVKIGTCTSSLTGCRCENSIKASRVARPMVLPVPRLLATAGLLDGHLAEPHVVPRIDVVQHGRRAEHQLVRVADREQLRPALEPADRAGPQPRECLPADRVEPVRPLEHVRAAGLGRREPRG